MTYEYKLPSGNVITFREPRNADRAKVLDLVKPNEKVSIDELLAAACVTAINGNKLQYADPKRLMDNWTLRDSQSYVNLFLEMFTVGDEDMKEIRETAKKLLTPVFETSSESEIGQS